MCKGMDVEETGLLNQMRRRGKPTPPYPLSAFPIPGLGFSRQLYNHCCLAWIVLIFLGKTYPGLNLKTATTSIFRPFLSLQDLNNNFL